jgi:hypothetical protein
MTMLSADRMSEAEVAVRLAQHLVEHPQAAGHADVAIDGAGVSVAGTMIFALADFLRSPGWEQVEQSGKNLWGGIYRRGHLSLSIHSRSGIGDVVAVVGGQRFVAECKKGPLVPKAGSPEYPLLTSALGQALLLKANPGDVSVAAVPDTPRFRRIAEAWRERHGVMESGILIALVSRDRGVSGLEAALERAGQSGN